MNFPLLCRLGAASMVVSLGLGQGLPPDFPTPERTPLGGVRLGAWAKPADLAPVLPPVPVARRHKLFAGPVVRLGAPDLAPIIAEDARVNSQAKGARRISLRRTLPAALAPGASKGSGPWQVLPDGASVWTAEIESEEALGVRLHFSGVVLPAGVELLVYAGAATENVAGPYGAAGLGGRDQFWSGTVFAPRVTVECVVPAGVPVAAVQFRIDELLHRYVALPLSGATAKAAESCNLDVTCEPDWLTTSMAVAGLGTVQISGELFCTGCLVNDADPAAGTDYVLTANHCVDSQVAASDVEFYWFYQTATCAGAPPLLSNRPRTAGGADFVAGAFNELSTDFALLRLRRPTPVGVIYAGWSSDPVAPGTEVVGIHHPSGDFKRISFGQVAAIQGEYWSVQWERGITEPGSSGSPLFSPAHEFIGQLYGGRSSCHELTGQDIYGRFDSTFAVIAPWLLGEPVVVANDHLADAQVIVGLNGELRGSSAGASKDPGEPSHANNGGGKSVWYRWTAPADSLMTFTTTGSGFDTLLAVYTGPALEALALVKNNNDSAEYPLSSLSFNATAGTTYWIAVDGYDGAGGTVGLNWLPGADSDSSSNDNFSEALELTGGRGEVGVANRGATKEPGEPEHADMAGGASVWFRWTAPVSGPVFFDTEGSDIDTVLAVYLGPAVDNLSHPVASSDDIDADTEIYTSRVNFVATAGQTYYVAVDGYGELGMVAEQGFVLLTWYPPPPTLGAAPAHNLFSAAQVLTGNAGVTTGTNLRATKEPGEPDHTGTPGGRSVWYRWTATANGLISLDTAGSNFDSVLAVYTGNSVGALTLLGGNDDVDRATRQSRVTVRASAGTVYRVAVDGYLTFSDVLREGAVRLAWSFEAGGDNDDFAQARILTGLVGRVTGENRSASVEPGEPRHAGNQGGASTWFRWVAPANGPATFDTLGSTFDTVLAIYSGTTVAGLFELARGDDISPAREIYTSRATFPAVQGQVYQLAVDGYRLAGANADPVETGSIVLNWELKTAAELGLLNPAVGPAGFSVTATGGSGDRVTLQVTTGFGQWLDVTTMTLDASGAALLSDAAAASRANGFYRVIRP